MNREEDAPWLDQAAAATAAKLREQYRLRARLPVYRRRVMEAERLIDQALAMGPFYVAFSGGKDSMALLHLVQSRYPDIPGYFIDSGAETPATHTAIAAMRERGHHIETVYPRRSIIEMCQDAGWWGAIPTHGGAPKEPPFVEWKRVLIYEPAQRIRETGGYIGGMLGLRREENRGRAIALSKYGPLHQYPGGDWRSAPLAYWCGADVMTYLLIHHLPLSDIYLRADDTAEQRERRRTGTALGTSAIRWGRMEELRRCYPAFWQDLVQTFPGLLDWS